MISQTLASFFVITAFIASNSSSMDTLEPNGSPAFKLRDDLLLPSLTKELCLDAGICMKSRSNIKNLTSKLKQCYLINVVMRASLRML